jgi:predicted ribosome quality control (RQC) complex YloA/Tae2 family protein
MRIEIDFRKSAQENLAEYFGEVKHAKKKLVSTEQAVEKTKVRLEQQLVEPVKVVNKPKPLPSRWFEKLRWTFSQDGMLIVGGRDATQNEIIYKKYIEPQDIVLHADVAGAPLTVIKTQGHEPSVETLKEAAQFAGVYSSAWKRGVGTIEVYWIKPDQVAKESGLSKGSFMISGKRNYLRAMMRIAIGVKNGLVFSGTEACVKQLCNHAIVITPGSTSKVELAKQVKLKLLRLTNDESILHINFYEFERVIPSGKGDMV